MKKQQLTHLLGPILFINISILILILVLISNAKAQDIDSSPYDKTTQNDLRENGFDPYSLLYLLGPNEVLVSKNDSQNESLCHNVAATIMDFIDPKEILGLLSNWSQNLKVMPKATEKPHSSLKAWFNYLGRRVRLAPLLRTPLILHAQTNHEFGRSSLTPHAQLFSPSGNEYILIKNEKTPDKEQNKVTPCVYTTETGELKFQLIHPSLKNRDHITDTIFSQNGQFILTTEYPSSKNDDFVINIWDAHLGLLINSLNFKNQKIHQLFLSNDGKKLMTSLVKKDETLEVKIWDTITKNIILSIDEIDNGVKDPLFVDKTNFATLSPNGKIVATNNPSLKMTLWDAENSHLRHFINATRINDAFSTDNKVIFSPNSQFILSQAFNNPSEIWGTQKGTLISTLKNKKKTFASCEELFFSQDSQLVGGYFEKENSFPYSNGVGIWETKTGNLIQSFFDDSQKFPPQQFKQVNSLALSPDGKILMTCGYDEIIRFWDIKTGQLNYEVNQYLMDLKKISICLSPDFRALLVDLYQQSAPYKSPDPVSTHILKLNFFGNKAPQKSKEQEE